MYLYIILKKIQPEYFLSTENEIKFEHKGSFFSKINAWQGGFYSYLTFKKENNFYLFGLVYNFSVKMDDFIKEIEKLDYVSIFNIISQYQSTTIEIHLINETKKISFNEESNFSQWFGDDFLYKNDITDEYCLVFDLPKEIKLSR